MRTVLFILLVVSDRNRDGIQDLTFWSFAGIAVGMNTRCVP